MRMITVFLLAAFAMSGLVLADPTRGTNVVAVKSRNGEGLEVFARGPDNVLFSKTMLGVFGVPKHWSSTPWQRIQGATYLSSHPAAAATKEGVIAVFARGRDNLLHGCYELNPSNASPSTRKIARWSSWNHVGGTTTMASMPVVTTLSDGRLVVFSVNEGAEVQYLVQTSPSEFAFSEWRVLGHLPVAIRGLPEVVTTPEGDVHVFAVGEDTNLYTAHVTPAFEWTPWRLFDSDGLAPVEGQSGAGLLRVRVGSTPGNRLTLFAFDVQNRLQSTFQRLKETRFWTPWLAFSPRDPSLVVDGLRVARDESTELITVVARTSRNTLLVRRQDRNTGWSAWSRVGGHVKRDPFIVSEPSSGIHLFAVGLDGIIEHRALTADGDSQWVPLPGIRCD